MDLRLSADNATHVEREAVDGICRASKTSGHTTDGGLSMSRSRRPLLLDGLWALQEASGAISRGGLNYLCVRLGVAPADAYGVATAYAMFRFESGQQEVIHVCDDIACRAAGDGDPFRRAVGDNGQAQSSPCLGYCEFGSAALRQVAGAEAKRETIAPFTGSGAVQDGTTPYSFIHQPLSELRLLRRVGRVDPGSIAEYRNAGGYVALERALGMGAEAVVAEVKQAKLLGRGGAAFPTATKWEAVRAHPETPHYFVCNADESEPGTFKDRVVMEHDPFAVVEAMTIAGFATGSEHGYLYIRGEYPLAEARIREAVKSAQQGGLLGENILNSGFNFDITVRRGAGAYIAGEETALFNSIEGKRPEPRNKPPYPTDVGLFGKPTAANNVETIINVLDIVIDGGEAFTQTGTADSTGTRLFCVSGQVERPGLYELPMGRSLRELLTLAGAFRLGYEAHAVLLGGAAGVFVGPDAFDLELSFEGARAAGVTLGSGVVIVFDKRTDFNEIIKRIARFFRDESCGQCVPCRVGTVRQEEMVARVAAGTPLGGAGVEARMYAELTQAMKDASICGLGQTATGAIESAMKLGLFPSGSRESVS